MIVLRPQYEGEEDSFRQLPLTGDSNEMVPPYYPGTEIDGYMPHRGDFAVVSPRHPTISLILLINIVELQAPLGRYRCPLETSVYLPFLLDAVMRQRS